MSGIQSKRLLGIQRRRKTLPIIRTKKNQSVETDPEMIQMIELVERDIKKLSLFCIISRR